MQRREFLSMTVGATMIHAGALTSAFPGAGTGSSKMLSGLVPEPDKFTETQNSVKPMAIGVMIRPTYDDPEVAISRVKDLGLSNCFLDLDDYIGRFSPSGAQQLSALLEKYGVTATAVEIVGPGPLVWNFLDGPSTIGLVPPATRAARIDALKQTSDFAKRMGISQVQTHCGFIPENPKNPLYDQVVLAIRDVAVHCAGNGQDFLMETGQETPTTMWRAIIDVNQPNLGVGLDTANLILYGKANPVDAVDMLGPHVRSVHAKDGFWPKNPLKLGEEVLIGTGCVDFSKVFSRLDKLAYKGSITIEREISGPQQIEDVKHERVYLAQILAQVHTNQT